LLVVLEGVLIFRVVLLLDVRLVSFSFRESSLNENDEIHSPVTIGSDVKPQISRSSSTAKSFLGS